MMEQAAAEIRFIRLFSTAAFMKWQNQVKIARPLLSEGKLCVNLPLQAFGREAGVYKQVSLWFIRQKIVLK